MNKYSLRQVLGVLWILVSVGGNHSSLAQQMSMGTNLTYAVDWSGEYPFVDLMKYSRPWGTQNNMDVPGGTNAFNTELIEQIPRDTLGYPLSLPYAVPGAEAPQLVYTMWHHGGTLPPGRYIVRYDGEGTFDFWGDVQVVSTDPIARRIEIDFLAGNNEAIVIMVLRTSTMGNHLKNIRVLMPGTENAYETQPWSQPWLDKLAPFSTLRFMNWNNIIFTNRSQWSERPHVYDRIYTYDGVPYEWMARLANDVDKDLWVNIPHAVDTTYIRHMATLFRDSVEAGRRIYVELSNEIWNDEYASMRHFRDNGDQNVPWPERIVPFIQQALDIWSDVFDGQLHRIVRVVGTHSGLLDRSERIVLNMRAGSFDAIAPAAYIYTTQEYTARLHAGSTADSVLTLAREIMLDEEWPLQQQQVTLAQRTNTRLIFYEGGQYFVPQPTGTLQPYNQAMVDAQIHPDIYQLYVDWFHMLETLRSDMLFMHFALVWRPLNEGRFSTFGSLYNQFDSPTSYRTVAPKYQAQLDYMSGASSSSLPVEMTQFDAKLDAGTVHLQWQTASETNNAGFDVQHRTGDGATEAWQHVGFVEGQGTTVDTQTYTFTIADVDSGTHQYRLKQVDFDGTASYSNEVSIHVPYRSQITFTPAYPNPFSSTTQFTLRSTQSQHAKVELYDLLGRQHGVVWEGQMGADEPVPIAFSGKALAAGVYVLQATGETFSVSQRIVRMP